MNTALNPRTASRLAIDDDAIARAEAALRSLSSQFGEWLNEELAKLEASRRAVPAGHCLRADLAPLYTHAHDLKGLGSTYAFPLISRIAASLCRLLDAIHDVPPSTLLLVDAHIDAIQAIVREERRDEEDAVGVGMAQDLEREVETKLDFRSGS